jgi:UDP-N-acetylmuramate--alanine ligase
MSAYARAASALGAQLSGSDCAGSPYLEALAADGVLNAAIGHSAENLPRDESLEVVYSSAVPEDNPERVAARRRGLSERPRAQLLAELSALRRTIAVAGTHGKTTTASMTLHALRGAGLDPGWLIGGSPGGGLANGHWSEGEWLVIEADESDRSMLGLTVRIAVLTSAELDHHATFASLAELREAFGAFLSLASEAIVIHDEPQLLSLVGGGARGPAGDSGTAGAQGESGASAAVGESEARQQAGEGAAQQAAGEGSPPAVVPYRARDYRLTRGGSEFGWRGLEVRLAVPGEHNVANAIAALEAARLAGASPQDAVNAVSLFAGAGRRFELLGESAAGALLYDDYAHHPSEIRATVAAARTLQPRRLIAVFQPHLYSRTARLARDFGSALAQADIAIVLDVYPARERAADFPGVSGLMLAEAAADARAGAPVYWLPGFDDAERVLAGLLAAGDLCVMMGAGDIDSLARRLVAA